MKKIFATILSLMMLLPLTVSAEQLIPDDLYFSDQWSLLNTGQIVGTDGNMALKAWKKGVDINVVGAWNVLYNEKSPAFNIHKDKSPIVVAVIDTGVDYTHEELRGRMFEDANGNIIGYDFVDNDSDPMDKNGHGTIIATIIAANSNNKIGIAGISWDAKIMPIRILSDSAYGDFTLIDKAIRFAVDNGADVINFSVVSPILQSDLTATVQYAYDNNVVIVAAAGNNNVNLISTPWTLINNENNVNMVIGVGAINSANEKFISSNFGAGVDVSAPGTNLVAVDYNLSNSDTGYYFVSGTSVATALVSGEVALIKSFHRDWTSQEIIERVIDTAVPFENGPQGMGAGRINVEAALGITLYQDKTPIITSKDQTVYITVGDNCVVPIVSPDVFLGLGYDWDDIVEVKDYELAMYKRKLPLSSLWMPVAGTVIKGSADAIYLVGSNFIKPFSTWNEFVSAGYSMSDVKIVSDVIINAYKTN